MRPFLKSLYYAVRGIKEALSEENFQIEVIVGFVAIIGCLVLKTSMVEKALILLSVGLVLGGEAINTALEKLSDFVSPAHHDEIRIIKDLAAGAVLIFSLVALMIGILIFGNILFGMMV